MKVLGSKETLAAIAGEDPEWACVFTCPSCGFNYTHIERVGTLVGTDPHESVASYPGTEPSGSSVCRRSAVEIVIWCEGCDNLSALVVQQDKGLNYIEVHKEVGKHRHHEDPEDVSV